MKHKTPTKMIGLKRISVKQFIEAEKKKLDDFLEQFTLPEAEAYDEEVVRESFECYIEEQRRERNGMLY